MQGDEVWLGIGSVRPAMRPAPGHLERRQIRNANAAEAESRGGGRGGLERRTTTAACPFGLRSQVRRSADTRPQTALLVARADAEGRAPLSSSGNAAYLRLEPAFRSRQKGAANDPGDPGFRGS